MRNPMPTGSRRRWSRPAIPARPGRPRPISECSSAMGSIISSTLSNAVIVDVEPTPARTYDEVASTKTMLDRTEHRFGLKPKRLAADTAYGTGRFLGWLVGHRIIPHIPVRDASERDDGVRAATFAGIGGAAFTSARTVRCCTPPAKCTRATHFDIALPSSTAKSVRSKCSAVPIAPTREVPRDVHEYARDLTRRLMRTKAFIKSRDQRKRVEMRFAHLKVHHGFERMRLRGLSGARDEFVLAAIVQNLKTLALRTFRPPPARQRAWLGLRSFTIISVVSASRCRRRSSGYKTNKPAHPSRIKIPKGTTPTERATFSTASTRSGGLPPSISALRKAHSITSWVRKQRCGKSPGGLLTPSERSPDTEPAHAGSAAVITTV